MAERPPLVSQVAKAQEGQGLTAVPPHSIPMEEEVVFARRRALFHSTETLSQLMPASLYGVLYGSGLLRTAQRTSM